MADNFYGITDTGSVRQNNEDTFIAQKTAGDKYILACVIDGVGGYHGGEIAAEIAREQILQHLMSPSGDLLMLLTAAVKKASKAIYNEKQKDKELESMACVATLAIADIANNQFYYAHVGDTRLYLLRDNSLVKISKDHSFVGFLEDSGRLTEEAAMNHPKRNEINKALGFGDQDTLPDDYIETGKSPFLPGDMLLLCSDGLTDMVDKQEITANIVGSSTLQQKGQSLIKAANKNGGHDNITVVLVKNDKEPLRQNATRPAAAQVEKNDLADLAQPKTETVSVTPNFNNATQPAKGSGKGTIVLLSILCLLFLGAAIWFYLQNRSRQPQQPATITTTDTSKRNASEISLQDSINKVKGDTLLLSGTAFKQPVILSDSIFIDKDTLYIKARNNFQLKSDSGYAGPGLVLSPKCKYIVLDSLTFQNFRVAVSTPGHALVLKKTQFINCAYPVQVLYTAATKTYISGRIPNSSFKTDSSTTTTKPLNGAR